jgi:Cys-tRNA(Pro)/Cys-tRNA(Cys) deacylase
MSTRAIQVLKKKRIPHELITYQHMEKGAEFAAQAVGFPLSQTIKTLVVSLDKNNFVLALMPGDCQLSLKKLASAFNAKRAVMADTKAAERLTGYLVGGISPFGIKKQLPVVMEQQLLTYDEVMINGGRRGVMLKMTPRDIVAALNAETIDMVNVAG